MTDRHEEMQEMLGVYALNAVDRDDRAMVEAHLETCAICRREVAEHRRTTTVLTGPGETAPGEVWGRISSSIEGDTPRLDLERVAPKRSWGMQAGLAAGAAAAAVAAFLGFEVRQLNQRMDDLAGSARRGTIEAAADQAALDPTSARAQLRAKGGAIVAHAVITSEGRGFLVDPELRPLSPNETYQLWALLDDERISVALLGNTPNTAAFQVSGSVDGLAITAEVAGGVSATDEEPVAQGSIRED